MQRVGLAAIILIPLLLAPLPVSHAAPPAERCTDVASLGELGAACEVRVPWCGSTCSWQAVRVIVEAIPVVNAAEPEVTGTIMNRVVCTGRGSCEGYYIFAEAPIFAFWVDCGGSTRLPHIATSVKVTCERHDIGAPTASCEGSTDYFDATRARCSIPLPSCGSACPAQHLYSLRVESGWLSTAPTVSGRLQGVATCEGTTAVNAGARCAAHGLATAHPIITFHLACEAWGVAAAADIITPVDVKCMRWPSPY